MPGHSSRTLRQAEKKALDGTNESQDTLVIAHHLMMSFGVGLRSSSPHVEEAVPLPSPRQSSPASERGDGLNSACSGRPTEQKTREEAGGVPRKQKMDSTQSSTQPNAGRSYDQYYHSSPNALAQSSPQPVRGSSPNVEIPVDDDDTAAVRFDDDGAAGTNKTVSPAQDDSGFVDFGSLARFHHVASQKTAQSPTQHLPETPAQSRNPFRHSRSQLLPTSQLFRGTQFSSPAKAASPTSSRPSPADFPGQTISPNPVVSSPLKARGLRSSPPVDITSSPGILPGTTSSTIDARAASPVHAASAENPVVPDSSHDGPARKRSGPEPMSTYEPMRKSQERRSTSWGRSDPVSSGEDDDSYDTIVRRRKAQLKKEAALKQLTTISFPRPMKSEIVEVPSTSQRRRTSQAEEYIAQCYGKTLTENDSECADAVKESQEAPQQPAQRRSEVDEESTQSDVEKPEPAMDPTPPTAPELPRSSTMSANLPAQASVIEGTSHADAIPETSPTGRRPEPLPQVAPSLEVPPSEAKSASNFRSSPPAFRSTESLRQFNKVARRGSNSTDELSRSVSATPTFEQSLRVSRLSVSRPASRSGRAAMRPPPTQRDLKLFENMAFAISFQSRKPGESNDQYSARTDFSAMLQKRIRQAGGRILENGFDELFEVLPMETPSSSPAVSSRGGDAEIHLTPEGRSMGFTALIADGHSRKVKYMQALALGLPCIAARWITTCLDRNEVVDWSPYLLCAGQSAFLGDAIRSRSLTPYDPATAKLVDVIKQRKKLLEGSKILAVVKKSVEGKKMAYVFLARVLGAALTRVYSVEEAKAEMKAAEELGQPFDWVYVDGKPDEEALFASGPSGGRKRKRASTAASSAAGPPVKRVRTLSDELVIQSLILGRLIEEGEMDE
ncbi:efd0b97f-328f-472d-84ff-e52cb7f36d48 [Thermothielavioides terrestris]|uniref:Efd0b97f-328f-472d-84ff-e52cb7f36d48 n=1 Tax=Thermothielavioides terrestris TaxID=2587410 RepID=A0A446BGJ5_9PEZI|nr:efd0b97f-328f-472d-84ff-e52cb7f36d48 [Thermothielavioides terrestris]